MSVRLLGAHSSSNIFPWDFSGWRIRPSSSAAAPPMPDAAPVITANIGRNIGWSNRRMSPPMSRLESHTRRHRASWCMTHFAPPETNIYLGRNERRVKGPHGSFAQSLAAPGALVLGIHYGSFAHSLAAIVQQSRTISRSVLHSEPHANKVVICI